MSWARAFFAGDVRVAWTARHRTGFVTKPTLKGASSTMNTLKLDPPQDTSRTPSHQQIAARAYELYKARGEVPGHEQEDWLRAERELSDAASADAFTNEGGAPAEGKAPRAKNENSRSSRNGDRASSSQRH
jgi:hypothetical protein